MPLNAAVATAPCRSNSPRRGFSLVELSIVLAILGVVTAGGLTVGTTLVEQQANVASNTQLDIINKALRDYFTVNGRIPCPAAPATALGAAGFGTESGPCNAGGGGNSIGGGVSVGMLPTRALGLRDRSAADEFGNRYIYAVTERHTNTTDFTNVAYPGVITVLDGAGNNVATDVSYIVLSTGSDGKGARRFQTGAVAVACGATANLDVENCDADATFRDARFNNGSVVASFFDDFVRWVPKFHLSAAASASGGGLWANTGDAIYSVGNDSNTITGNVGVGTITPAQKLSVITTTALDGITLGDNTRTMRFFSGTVGAGSFSPMTQANDSMIMFSGGPIDSGGLTIAQWSASPKGMRIDALGNVGVGTGSPAARLHVVDAGGGGDNAIAIGGAAGTYREISILTNLTSRWIFGADNVAEGGGNAGSNFYLNSYNDAGAYLGTALGINRNTRNATFGGTVTATNYFVSSDRELKHDISPLFEHGALAIVGGINPVHFTWNETKTADTGVIAQDVEKVFPQAVEKDEKGFRKVAYQKLVLPVIEAVKELHKMVTDLLERMSSVEKRLDALEKENAALKARLEKLETESHKD